jgi:hypothetical protein
VLLSWWLTWAGLGYALLGVGANVLAKKVRLEQIALAAAVLLYILSIAGHAGEVLWFDQVQLPLRLLLGLAAAGLLALAGAVLFRLCSSVSRPSREAK